MCCHSWRHTISIAKIQIKTYYPKFFCRSNAMSPNRHGAKGADAKARKSICITKTGTDIQLIGGCSTAVQREKPLNNR